VNMKGASGKKTSKSKQERREEEEEESDSELEVAGNRKNMGGDADGEDADSASGSDEDSDEGSDEDSDEESEDSDDETERAKRELAEVPFGVLQELQKDGTHGTQERSSAKSSIANLVGKAPHKGAPVEMGSKKPVSRFRVVVPMTKKKGCDPRFEALSGQFNQDMFDKAYAFVGEKRETEIKELKGHMKKTKNKEKRTVIEDELKELQRVQQQELASSTNRSKLQERRRDERKAVAQGKKPFFLKKSDERVVALARRYEELSSKSPRKINDIAAKKLKKNAQKDHRFVPYGRRGD